MSQQPVRDLFEEGRTDPPHSLRDRLPSAVPQYAEGALENPSLDEGIVEVMLRNPGLPAGFLERLSRDSRFRRSDTIKRGIVMHPVTPWHVSGQLAKFLHWRELLAIADDRRFSNPLRQSAEKLVGDRLNQLPQPEKVRLARRASRGVIASFLQSRNPQVIQELLLNPRVLERDVLTLGSDPNTPSAVLGMLARHGQWNRRPAVRMAVLENISTPIPDALRLLPTLSVADLRGLSRNVRLPAPLRNEAQRALKTKKPGSS